MAETTVKVVVRRSDHDRFNTTTTTLALLLCRAQNVSGLTAASFETGVLADGEERSYLLAPEDVDGFLVLLRTCGCRGERRL